MKPKKTIREILEGMFVIVTPFVKECINQAEQEIKGLAEEDEISNIVLDHLVEYHCGPGREYNKMKSSDVAKALKQYWEGI